MTERQKNLLFLLIIAALVVVSVYIFYPPADKTRLGLDLQGGLEVILEAQGDVTSDKMTQTLDIIRNRVDKLGVSEPEITQQGSNQISVALAGITNMDEATELIGKTAQLEFKKVDQVLTAEVSAGTRLPDTLPPGKQMLLQQQRDDQGNLLTGEQGEPLMSPFVVDEKPLMTGEALAGASVGYDQFSKPKVDMEFTDAGAEQFAQITGELALSGSPLAPSLMAIVLDDEVISAPSVKEQIRGKNAEITGDMTKREVDNIVLVLQTGALPVELVIIDKSEVSATLGQDSLRQGLMAGAAGMAVVMIFLIFYYRLLGLIADIALIVYGVLFFAVLTNPWYPFTLTLPGIAGIILTVGVAADANVVIFERIKEEVRQGKTLRSAVSAGYSKGFHTILDANAVIIITALIIYQVATAGVKGFALTLIIGVLISMFTAVLATRAMLGILANLRLFNNPALMGLKVRRKEEQ